MKQTVELHDVLILVSMRGVTIVELDLELSMANKTMHVTLARCRQFQHTSLAIVLVAMSGALPVVRCGPKSRDCRRSVSSMCVMYKSHPAECNQADISHVCTLGRSGMRQREYGELSRCMSPSDVTNTILLTKVERV